MSTISNLSAGKRLLLMLATIPAILLIPFIAMQFTSEVNWSLADFVAMGALLLVTVLLCELVLRIVKKQAHRWILVSVVLFLFLLIWVELAVGIFGSPFAGS